MRAISAPRSQRVADHLARDLLLLGDRAHAGAPWPAASRRARSRATCRARACPSCDQSMRFIARLAGWSSAANSDDSREALARAARVLEQQRVEERGADVVAEPQLLGQPHPDRERAHRVAGRLALGDVERVGQRCPAPPRARRPAAPRRSSGLMSRSPAAGARGGSPGRSRSRGRSGARAGPRSPRPRGSRACRAPWPCRRSPARSRRRPAPSAPRSSTNARSILITSIG